MGCPGGGGGEEGGEEGRNGRVKGKSSVHFIYAILFHPGFKWLGKSPITVQVRLDSRHVTRSQFDVAEDRITSLDWIRHINSSLRGICHLSLDPSSLGINLLSHLNSFPTGKSSVFTPPTPPLYPQLICCCCFCFCYYCCCCLFSEFRRRRE